MRIGERMHKIRLSDFKINIGRMEKGVLNNICDVEGVKVGHCTIDTADSKTGCTVLFPCEDNPFVRKLHAASSVLNGFGKTAGLIQVDELGQLESPIVLTNTLNVGLMYDALVDYMIRRCKGESVEIKSFNPVVAECNDSFLNDIQSRVVRAEHLEQAISNAKKAFEEGDVGAGKGMSCYQLKGGIGSASRLFEIGDERFTLGVMVLSNHGLLTDLMIDGEKTGERIASTIAQSEQLSDDRGSVIVILATDLPLSSRQLKRVCFRASNGLARTGSKTGHGSGEIVIGFSTANRIDRGGSFHSFRFLNENEINLPFRAAVEATEEAVLSSMINAATVQGHENNIRRSIREYLK